MAARLIPAGLAAAITCAAALRFQPEPAPARPTSSTGGTLSTCRAHPHLLLPCRGARRPPARPPRVPT